MSGSGKGHAFDMERLRCERLVSVPGLFALPVTWVRDFSDLCVRGWESVRKSDCELRFGPPEAIHNKHIFWAATTCPIHHERNIHNVGSANEAISIA